MKRSESNLIAKYFDFIVKQITFFQQILYDSIPENDKEALCQLNEQKILSIVPKQRQLKKFLCRLKPKTKTFFFFCKIKQINFTERGCAHLTDTTTTTTTINKIIKKTANRVEIQFLFIVNPNDQKSVFMALLQVRNGVSTLLTLGVWFLSAIICTGPLSGVYIICLHNVYMKKKKKISF